MSLEVLSCMNLQIEEEDFVRSARQLYVDHSTIVYLFFTK